MSVLCIRDENGEFVEMPVIRGSDGKDGKDGSDANVTTENIEDALGYSPANSDQMPIVESKQAAHKVLTE